LDEVVVVAPHLDQQGVGIVALELLQLSPQVAIAVPALDEISQPQLDLAHFSSQPAQVASEVVIDSLAASLWAVHMDFVVELRVFLVVSPPPPSL
jgi:hypothetical protein